MKKLKTLTLLLLTLFFISCSDKNSTEEKSLTDIYKENGVPVKIQEIKTETFIKILNITETISGIEESVASSLIKDKVDKIYFKVGDYVNKDQTIISFPEDNPAAKYYQVKANFTNAEQTFKRMKNLYESKSISQQDYDNSKAVYDTAAANWDSASKMIFVKAPIDGWIISLDVYETDNVNPGDSLFTISKYNRVKTKLWISQKEISGVKKGNKAYAIWENKKYPGIVERVDLGMDKSKQAFAVIVEFDNKNLELKSGTTLDIEIETYKNPSAVLIDKRNLINKEDQYFVYVTDNGTAHKREVFPGIQDGAKIEILSGLNSGEKMITEGAFLLEDGSKINIIE